ncbi:FAD-dependent oxidoreductase [Amphritea sp.]|uniref:FAD-dependent oxidoreductase n=1 Tax=Amphritea sp. TaxID=1872502 RepID=UPI003566033A
MNSKTEKILVIGAGASGLAFALECIDHGFKVRLIDRRSGRSMIEKATGIAQGVWNQLDKFQISPRSIAEAIPMSNFAFYDDAKLISNVTVPAIDGKQPAHLFPQGELEKILEHHLAKMGVLVEYGVQFLSIIKNSDTATVRLIRNECNTEEICEFKWVIGADGAHSEVRSALEVPFQGREYPEQWSVAEINTRQWPSSLQAKLHLQSDGVGFFLSQPALGTVQGILNAPGAGVRLKEHFRDAEIKYERAFKVSLRRVLSPRAKCFWLIGDAAHVQSPVGGQGLNLAIWDGITLAEALMKNDLSVEARLAKRARNVLFFTDFDYRMLATKNTFIRTCRNYYWSAASKYPFLARWFFKIISGVW